MREDSKRAKCSTCGQPMKTALGAVSMANMPLVCRRCFGEQSYGGGSSHWSANPLAPGSQGNGE